MEAKGLDRLWFQYRTSPQPFRHSSAWFDSLTQQRRKNIYLVDFLTRIHTGWFQLHPPISDGNGRIGRLVMNDPKGYPILALLDCLIALQPW
jgi:hypothetical protein